MSLTNLIISGNVYVSWATIQEADNYLLVDPIRSTAWFTLTDDMKARHLVAATRRVETEVILCNGGTVPTNPVPTLLEQATILLAGSIAGNSEVISGNTNDTQIESVKAGSAEVTLKDSITVTSGSNTLASKEPDAHALIICYLESTGIQGADPGIYAEAFGTNTPEPISTQDRYRLREGYA